MDKSDELLRRRDVERALKDHLIGLIDRGIYDVEITELNAQLHEILCAVRGISSCTPHKRCIRYIQKRGER